MTAPMYSASAPPFVMEAFYEDRRYRVLVRHEADAKIFAEAFVPATWEPVFGIDVADLVEIKQAAEGMASYLESTL